MRYDLEEVVFHFPADTHPDVVGLIKAMRGLIQQAGIARKVLHRSDDAI